MPPQDTAQLPPGYVLDPSINSSSNLSPAALQALHAQAEQAASSPAHPFDRFDAPAAPSAGSTPRATDAQLLSLPRPTTPAGHQTDAQLLALPAPSSAPPSGFAPEQATNAALPRGLTLVDPGPAPSSASLPPGFTLISAGQPSTALPPGYTLDRPSDPGLLARVGGIVGRGVLDGAAGVASAAQAAGRFVDAHSGSLPAWLPGADAWNGIDAADRKIDHLPVQQLAATAADRAGFYRPQQASGTILEGAVGGATGAALTGGVGLPPMSMAAGAGAAAPIAKAAGASDQTAADVALATALLPAGAVGAAAARSGAAALAKGAYVASIAKSMTPEQAAQQVLLHDAMTQYATAGGRSLSSTQAAQGYGAALNDAISAYRKTGLAAGGLDADQSSALMSAQRAANAGAGGGADVRSLALPGYHQDAVQTSVGQLDALAAQAPTVGQVGPVAAAAKKITPLVAGASALGAFHAGDWAGAAELAAAAAAGKSVPGVSAAISRFGGIGDTLLGSSMTPAEAQLAAARRVVAKSGVTLPSTSPLADLQTAVSDVRGDLADQATNAANDTQDAAKAKQVQAGYAQNSKAAQAVEAAWAGALSQQARQTAAGSSDPLAAALWRDAEQQSSTQNLAAVTASQVRGYQADQSGLARRDAQEQAADAAAQQRGQNLSEQAGAWMERQQIARFQAANPGVPVPGAGAMRAQTPQQLFEATAGRFGSPADPTPQMVQPPAAAVGAPQRSSDGPPAASTPAPATPLPATSTAPSTGLGASPLTPSGGQALVSMLHQQHFGTPLQTPDITAAIEDLAADGSLHPYHADAALSGQPIDRQLAGHIAARAQLLKSQGQTGLDQGAISSQAQADVQAAMGNAPPAAASTDAMPNGGPRGPILNLTRYQGAVGNYQRHAQQMFMLATSPAEKQAISEIAATPGTADKAAIRDAYVNAHPGADLSRFTARLMKGT